MSISQVDVLTWAYEKGKPHGFAQTMRAICWQESSAGADLENKKDRRGGSYGRFGTTLFSARARVNREIKTETPHLFIPDDLIIHLLKTNHDVAAHQCLLELRFWYRTWGEDFHRIWASYNAGHDFRKGRSYADQILAKVRFLRGK